MKLIVTCEHGGNTIPKAFEKYFKGSELVLNSHRGYDLGTLDVFNALKPLANESLYSETSRLLIELNRSLHHKSLFSEFTKNISKKEKQHLINSHYLVYRKKVENTIQNWIEKGESVLHISVHSFTPILNNVERNCDIGLLYDSKKNTEKTFCSDFKKELKNLKPGLNVRYNYPYLGKADGFTTYLRKQFESNYIGVEIEINQKYSTKNNMSSELKVFLFSALKTLLTKSN
ncbi:Predicted N-formylglutamate amidohydrolase [Flaviramulus basaltis]|uniref:Predicted N-formylglutamate amidohydrolase n=1 Tax=Flaviramulus basaltis TaxID=369401 RepID=A0A1K2IKV3_9FLAO|nr:N-formylglutamate amidohydrolase [Flaviramulus basaltis]SFZ92999.1 Predicted N-formylglutamate amidohydrolase [Flaviramulus basaltis]